jgi:hypothetical protein
VHLVTGAGAAKIAGMPKRTYDPAMIRRLLNERASNQWSLGELSRRSGIPLGTLGTWAARARHQAAASSKASRGFAEVVVSDAAAEEDASVLLRHESGWMVELHGAAAAMVATRLAEALTRCS